MTPDRLSGSAAHADRRPKVESTVMEKFARILTVGSGQQGGRRSASPDAPDCFQSAGSEHLSIVVGHRLIPLSILSLS